MSLLKRTIARVNAFFHKPQLDAELEAELAAHLEMAIDDNVARGLPPEEARRLALVGIGGMEQAKSQHRETRGLMKIDIFLQDLKYSFRTLRRDRVFTAAAVLILTLGIGANIAVFSVVDTLLLRPLPFADAHQLVWIAPPPAKCGLSCATYSTDAYDAFRAYTRTFQDVTGYFAFSTPGNLSLRMSEAPVPATSIDVISNFFNVLGVRPAMGRVFTADDALNGAPPVMLLTYPWWKRQFAGDPAIVGKTFDINGRQTTVIGVLPKTFDFGAVFSPGSQVDAITPLNLYGPPRDWGNIITFIGRMKPGVTLAQATGDAAQAAPHMCWNNRVSQSCGSYNKGTIPIPLKDYVSGRLRKSLIVLWSAVGVILLIACVNLSNLMLARAAARSKEYAMRKALGATRGRILRQLLTESLILSCSGAIMGLGLAFILVTWLAHQGAVALPLLSTLHIDGAALLWTLFTAIAAAALFGLLPGLRMTSGNLHEALKDSGPGSGQSRKHERTRSVLVASEVALACMLLVGAGLLLRSFLHVLDVDLGFDAERAAAIKVDYGDGSPQPATVANVQKRTADLRQIIARVSAIPGVEAAGISDYLPMGGNRSWGTPWPKGAARPDKLPTGPLTYVVTPGYLRAMGTGLRGRDFTWDDGPTAPRVVMINRSYANFLAQNTHWPNNEAVGQVLTGSGHDLLVVGVSDDIHAEHVEGDAGWQIYYPAMQESPVSVQLVIRTTMAPAALASSVLSTLRDINPNQPAAEFRPIQMLVNHANSPRRFFMLLVASFAGLGLLLAALGIYGVISYSVTRRTQEIGIRMALGASTGRVQRQVLAGTMRLALIGIVVGATASVAVARLIASLLFATSPWDVGTYIGMALVLLAVALVSGYLPARRASRISPLVALRTD
jgi:predicted permease